MRKILLTAAAVLLILPLRSVSQQAEKVSLRFAPAVGVRLTYGLNGMVSMSGKNLLGKDLSLTAVSNGQIQFDVQTSTRETVRARISSPGIDITVKAPERSVSETLKTQEGRALDAVFNRTGRVEEIRNAEALSQEKLLNFSIPQILRDYFPILPAQPVGPGDRWKDSRRLTIPYQGFELQVNLTVEYTLNDLLPSLDGRKASISATYTVSVSGSKDLGESKGVFEGGGTGTGFLHFLVDRGVFTEYRIDFQTNASFVMKNDAQRLLEWPFSFSVFAELTLTGPPGF